jgi:hypothetical protein
MTRRTTHVLAAVAAVCAVTALSACELDVDIPSADVGAEITDDRAVTEVTAVELRSVGTLNLSVGDTPSLVVTAGEKVMDDVTTQVQGDTLVIDLGGSWRNPGYLQYDLVLPALSTVTLSGSGEVIGEMGGTDVRVLVDGSGDVRLDEFVATAVTVQIDGSGDVDLSELGAEDVVVEVDGSGDVRLEGSTQDLTISIPGSGEVAADELAARTCTVGIDGSGQAAVDVSQTLDAVINGSGDIVYTGDPADVTRQINGAGEIRQG